MTACSVSRQASAPEDKSRTKGQSSISFLTGISVPVSEKKQRVATYHETSHRISGPAIEHDQPRYIFSSIESSAWIHFKYAILLEVAVEEISNTGLINFIDEWYKTKYRYGGTSKKGIDCSAFSGKLLMDVFGLELPRTCREQYRATSRVSKEALQEGDLVFFNTKGGISHVGVYLTNNKFVHASASEGVMISDLRESYFARRYVGAGRPGE